MVDSTQASGPAGEGPAVHRGWRASLFGLGTAMCFSTSAIFIRMGLEDVPSPLLGVSVAMLTATSIYGLILLLRRNDLNNVSLTRDAVLFQIAAGIFVGLSTWMRWIALDLAPIAVVLALGRLNVPMVIAISPYLVGKKQERVTPRVWIGASLIVVGSLVLIFFR